MVAFFYVRFNIHTNFLEQVVISTVHDIGILNEE